MSLNNSEQVELALNSPARDAKTKLKRKIRGLMRQAIWEDSHKDCY